MVNGELQMVKHSSTALFMIMSIVAACTAPGAPVIQSPLSPPATIVGSEIPIGSASDQAKSVVLPAAACLQPDVSVSDLNGASMSKELQFETIEAREAPKPDYWRDRKPGLLIIASPEDIGKASQYISDEAIATLERMDFSDEFAVIAFHGWKPTVYYDFEVQKVVRQNDQISIFARSGHGGHEEAESSLYYLIKISKRDSWGQIYTFCLYLDDKESDAIPVAAFIP